MSLAVLLTSLLIVVARIADVSLDTVRLVQVVQGRRTLAFVLGFVEILIWIVVVSRVINEIQQPAYAVAYALGYALGNYIGVTIEQRLALGLQAVRIITRQGIELAQALRATDRRVTLFEGHGRDGPVQELFIAVERRLVPAVLAEARRLDPRCYYVVDDVRRTSARATSRLAGWWPPRRPG